jgi:DMSO/TMAO reductase YedYZ heme-binding membrane subunit
MRTLLHAFFWLHDITSDFLAKHLLLIKRLILIGAHLSLFGLLFPVLRKDFGEMAEIMLLGILFLSPLSKLFRMRLLLQLMGLRREMGITMAYLATVHVLGFFLDPEWYVPFVDFYLGQQYWKTDPSLLFGLIAYLLTLPLLFTSNSLAQRFLGGRNWKRLHRVVYVVFIAVAFHKSLVGKGVTSSTLFEATALVLVYLVAKLLAWKNFFPPLEKLIVYVASQYRIYRGTSSPSQTLS